MFPVWVGNCWAFLSQGFQNLSGQNEGSKCSRRDKDKTLNPALLGVVLCVMIEPQQEIPRLQKWATPPRNGKANRRSFPQGFLFPFSAAVFCWAELKLQSQTVHIPSSGLAPAPTQVGSDLRSGSSASSEKTTQIFQTIGGLVEASAHHRGTCWAQHVLSWSLNSSRFNPTCWF